MSESTSRYLDAFPNYLKSLGSDVLELSEILKDESVPAPVRRQVAGSVNYLFKSLDLIPDGVEDIGYLDDAFVLRIAASLAVHGSQIANEGQTAILVRFAEESALIKEFLGDTYGRFETYVKALAKGAARGRTVDEILGDGSVRDALLADVAAWSASYESPSFTREESTLTKMLSFLDSKLPR
ncbi:MAG: YkvA family protein [Polyangiaceae bacterium]